MAIKTITRLYDSYDEAEKVVRDLRDAGVPAEDVSIVASNASGRYADSEAGSRGASGAATGAGIGAILGGGAGLLAGIGALALPGVGPFIAAGPIMASLAGLGVGGAVGGFVGALVGMGIPEFEAKLYDLRVKDGGVLVAVHCESSEGISKARDVLKAVGAEEIATCLEESLSSSCEDSGRAA